ncbi:hypothetical protein DevBK_00610 [Devosia sp. BK]|uniref:hypothetical protein n=1 Tax=Devosia sp. BK TaxID=2871706 RepID=UPI00293A0D90|nr:hypothetical protein [Devosia sp. BK]MDV3249820.1 hypothetical protein [Devosia sp. BK]
MNRDMDGALASGLDRDETTTLLRTAEPRRMANLAASLNLCAGIFFLLLGSAPFEGSFLWPIVAIVVAGMAWTVSNRLWRDIALASVAETVGVRWGQSQFASGWGTVDIEKWIADLFSEEGVRFTAWESQGKHRDTAYRLNEATIWRRRSNQRRYETFYLMEVQVAVPHSFAGSVELRPHSKFMTGVDDLFRQLSGDEVQRRVISPQFDAVFDTLASPNADVDKLLTPGFQQAMLALAKRNPHSYVSGRFQHGWFSFRLPIPHLAFSSAGLLKPMAALIDDVDTLWWDLTIPHRLIDSLTGDYEGPLR